MFDHQDKYSIACAQTWATIQICIYKSRTQ